MMSKLPLPGQTANEIPAVLALEDGLIFAGRGFGATGTTTGELVFNTSLTGYQEILSDPSYAGQVITMTCPEIGNYGTTLEDLESQQIFASALVVRHLSRRTSSWRAQMSLAQFLASQHVIGITDVDTRAITRHIRDRGAMRCAVSTEILEPDKLVQVAKAAPSMNGANLTGNVTTSHVYHLGDTGYKVAVWDFGVKRSILTNLVAQGMALTVFPAATKASEILSDKPDAIFLSNGPGDPAACRDILAELPQLIAAGLPMFGICLGHQLLSIALGCQTYKLKFGHRGGNQPVKDLTTGKVEITCQNHGFAVDQSSMPDSVMLTHVNLNDNSVEGFAHKSSPGPKDANYLFKRFATLIQSTKSW